MELGLDLIVKVVPLLSGKSVDAPYGFVFPWIEEAKEQFANLLGA